MALSRACPGVQPAVPDSLRRVHQLCGKPPRADMAAQHKAAHAQRCKVQRHPFMLPGRVKGMAAHSADDQADTILVTQHGCPGIETSVSASPDRIKRSVTIGPHLCLTVPFATSPSHRVQASCKRAQQQ